MIQGLSERLLISRMNKKLTRKQVATLIGCTESLIGLYENGSRQPSLSALMKLATIYNITTDYLLGIEHTDNNSLSLTGLTDKQIQALTLTASCFRNQNI